MNNLKKAIEDLVTKSLHPITFTGDRPCQLNKWIYKYSDSTDILLSEIIESGRILQQHELSFIKQEELRKNWRYYTSGMDNNNLIYSEAEDVTNSLLCSVCCIYSGEKKDNYFYIRSSLPISMYVNGEKICASNYGYHIKPFSLIIELESGINTILVTQEISDRYCQLSRSEYSFFIGVKPVSFIRMVDNEDIYYSSSIETLYHGYYIVPYTYRVFDRLSMEIFRQYQSARHQREAVTLTVKDAFGNMLTHQVITGESISITLKELKDGPLRIHCEGSGTDVYVFKGNYEKMLEEIRRKVNNEEFNIYIEHVFKHPDSNLVFNYGKLELIYEKILYILFSQLTRLLKAICSGKDIMEQYFWQIGPGDIITHLMKSDVDGAYMSFTFFIPDNFTIRKKSKAIIFMPYGTLIDFFPDIPSNIIRSEFQDFIVVTVYGRGGLNRDYVSEAQMVKIINYIYNLDFIDETDRYAVGICSGALRAYGLAMRFPGMFTAIASIGGTVRMDINHPQYDELQILDNTMIYNICNIEDEFFNSSRVFHTNSLMQKEKSFIFDSFTHKEITENLVTKKIASHLLKHNGEIPSSFRWSPQDNIYNKAYWVTVLRFADIRKKSFVDIAVTNGGYLLMTDNISELQIEIEEIHFDKTQELIFSVNQFKETIVAGPNDMIMLNISEERISCNKLGKVRTEYDIRVDSLGIKSIYLKRHAILKPTRLLHNNVRITRKLIMMFRQPLREKERNYGYDEIEDISLRNDACVIQFFDSIEDLEIRIPYEYKEAEIILYMEENNFFIYTSCADAVEILAKLIAKFDTEKIFLSSFIMYKQGKFYYESNRMILRCEKDEIV